MSKLTPPSIRKLEKRKKFFIDHPDFPKAEFELERIENLQLAQKRKQFKNHILKSKGKRLLTNGAFGRPPEGIIKKIELEVS